MNGHQEPRRDSMQGGRSSLPTPPLSSIETRFEAQSIFAPTSQSHPSNQQASSRPASRHSYQNVAPIPQDLARFHPQNHPQLQVQTNQRKEDQFSPTAYSPTRMQQPTPGSSSRPTNLPQNHQSNQPYPVSQPVQRPNQPQMNTGSAQPQNHQLPTPTNAFAPQQTLQHGTDAASRSKAKALNRAQAIVSSAFPHVDNFLNQVGSSIITEILNLNENWDREVASHKLQLENQAQELVKADRLKVQEEVKSLLQRYQRLQADNIEKVTQLQQMAEHMNATDSKFHSKQLENDLLRAAFEDMKQELDKLRRDREITDSKVDSDPPKPDIPPEVMEQLKAQANKDVAGKYEFRILRSNAEVHKYKNKCAELEKKLAEASASTPVPPKLPPSASPKVKQEELDVLADLPHLKRISEEVIDLTEDDAPTPSALKPQPTETSDPPAPSQPTFIIPPVPHKTPLPFSPVFDPSSPRSSQVRSRTEESDSRQNKRQKVSATRESSVSTVTSVSEEITTVKKEQVEELRLPPPQMTTPVPTPQAFSGSPPPAQPPPNPRLQKKMGIKHFDLAYDQRKDRRVCRMCLARLKTDRKATVVSFPANPGLGDAGSNWLKMDRHLLEDHPTGYESLLNMTETEIISMKQNMKIKTGGL